MKRSFVRGSKAPNRSWRRPRYWVAGGTLALAVTLILWTLWPTASEPYKPEPRSEQFISFTVCVLTDHAGVGGTEAAPVWAGVEDAAKATHLRGSFLAVPAHETEAIAAQYVNALASRRCDLIAAVGDYEVQAVEARATAYPRQSFVVIGQSTPIANIKTVPPGQADEVQNEVLRIVEQGLSSLTRASST